MVHRGGRWLLRALTIVVVGSLSLAACAPSGIRLRTGSEDMQPCDPAESAATVAADQVAGLQTDCNWEGLTIEFPDGAELVTPEVGATVGSTTAPGDNPEHVLINLGLDGIFVATWLSGELTMWGTPAALDLALEGYKTWYTAEP